MFFKSKSSEKSKPPAENVQQEPPAANPAPTPDAGAAIPPAPAAVQTKTTAPGSNIEPQQDTAMTQQPTNGQPPAEQPATEQQESLPPEELRKRAVVAKQTSASFGDIVRLLMQSNEFKKLKLEDLNGLVVPAVATGQFLTAEAQSKTNGAKMPVATVLWASVSEEVDQRFTTDLGGPVNLAAKEWKSGNIPWLIAAAGDRRLIADMLKRVQSDVFKGQPMKLRSRDENGQTVVTTVDELQQSRH